MTFKRQQRKNPTKIGRIEFVIIVDDTGIIETNAIAQLSTPTGEGAEIAMLDDLMPYLTEQQATRLTAILAAVERKATRELFPKEDK